MTANQIPGWPEPYEELDTDSITYKRRLAFNHCLRECESALAPYEIIPKGLLTAEAMAKVLYRISIDEDGEVFEQADLVPWEEQYMSVKNNHLLRASALRHHLGLSGEGG